MRAWFPNSMPLMVISEEGAAGEKEQLKMAPRKRQLLDSDEEQEEDEGRSKGKESDWDLLFLLTSSTLLLSPEDQCYSPPSPLTYLDTLSSHPCPSHSPRVQSSRNPKEETVPD